MYGHTHSPVQVPLVVLGEYPNERYRVYFNTGTWRPLHRMSADHKAFASWRSITYTLVYRPGEIGPGGSPLEFPSAESWTGTVVAGRGRRLTVVDPG